MCLAVGFKCQTLNIQERIKIIPLLTCPQSVYESEVSGRIRHWQTDEDKKTFGAEVCNQC